MSRENEPEYGYLIPAQNSLWKDFLTTTGVLLLLLGVAFGILTFVGQRVWVEGDSMEPAYSEGDQLLVNKLVYRFGEPKRYDVVVFRLKEDPNTNYIKRIFGLPGDSVRISEDGKIWINNEPIEDPYGAEPMADPGIAGELLILEPDTYFVLGDNRNASKDSRNPEVGPVNRSQLMGEVFARIWKGKKAFR